MTRTHRIALGTLWALLVVAPALAALPTVELRGYLVLEGEAVDHALIRAVGALASGGPAIELATDTTHDGGHFRMEIPFLPEEDEAVRWLEVTWAEEMPYALEVGTLARYGTGYSYDPRPPAEC